MRNPFFRFKQFEIWHNKCAMKVGTDGVLLGAWTPVEGSNEILDIGTGTGLVALMLAQRSNAPILGVDIDTDAVIQAKENVERSPWNNRVEIFHADVTTWYPEKRFDLIVSNPPYFNASLKSGNNQRDVARHTDNLSDNSLLNAVNRLLTSNGRFVVILPYDKTGIYEEVGSVHGLYITRQLEVVTQVGQAPKRVILVMEFLKKEKIVERLAIELSRHQYTPGYMELTREFYLDK